VINVLGSRALDWFLDVDTISPEILVFWTRGHHGTFLRCAEFCDASIKQIDLVEEIHGVDGKPLVDVLIVWQRNGLLQISTTKGSLRMLVQVISFRSFVEGLLRFEGAPLVAKEIRHNLSHVGLK